MLQAGKLDSRYVDLDVADRTMPMVEIFSNVGMEEMGINFKDMLGSLMPKNTRRRKIKVPEAMKTMAAEEAQNLVDMERWSRMPFKVEQAGIIFLDEIDKIAGNGKGHGPDVSREGVQRDLLPIVEGSTVNTKYGPVKTDHILFIASGAFHTIKPSDLIPELQGRFPIRVTLDALNREGFFPYPDRTEKRAAASVYRIAEDRRRGTGLFRRCRRKDCRDCRRGEPNVPKTSVPGACTPSWSACWKIFFSMPRCEGCHLTVVRPMWRTNSRRSRMMRTEPVYSLKKGSRMIEDSRLML
jgi:hypothetical protein